MMDLNQLKLTPKRKEICEKLRDKELLNKENFRRIAISCRWAELLLRDKEKQNKKQLNN